MRILAIDPGTTESAFIFLEDGRPVEFAKIPNWSLLEQVRRGWAVADHMAVEMIASYGMPVGKEVFETVLFIGRLLEAWQKESTLVYRREVKIHLCASMKAKDGNIRQALIDRFGGEAAIGKKKTPGPLYGISGDVWSALAVAITFAETVAAPSPRSAFEVPDPLDDDPERDRFIDHNDAAEEEADS